MSRKFKPNQNTSNAILAFVVITSMLGLLGFGIIDEGSRSTFLEVSKMSIAAFLGYLIPNGK
jgi:hypothetical protein